MKALLALSLTLGLSSAYAANDSVKICNPDNATQFMSLTTNGSKITASAGDASGSDSLVYDIQKTTEASAQELADYAKQTDINATLAAGTIYRFDNANYLIANDTTGVKYLLMVISPYAQLLGSSAYCK